MPIDPLEFQNIPRSKSSHSLLAADMLESPVAVAIADCSLQEVCDLMKQTGVEDIPIIDNYKTKTFLGTISAGAICQNIIAAGINPCQMKARDCLQPGNPAILSSSIEEVKSRVQRQHQATIPVVDEERRLIGTIRTHRL